MRKFLVFIIIIKILCSVCFAQGGRTLEVTGYGKTKERALNDAYTYAVQEAVGTLISSEIYIANGELIDEKIIAHSEGYVENYETIKPYDGKAITIKATVRTKHLNDELIQYTKPTLDGKGTGVVEFDGSAIIAKHDSQLKMMRSRIKALQTQGDILFNELFTARSIYVEKYTEPKAYDKDNFQFDITISQSINDIRYSSAIIKYSRLLSDVGATTRKWSVKNALDPLQIARDNNYTVVLVNIDGSVTAHTFDEETFTGLHKLFYQLACMNLVQTAKISFLDEKIKSVYTSNYDLNGSPYYLYTPQKISIQQLALPQPQSFVITNNITNTKLINSVTIARKTMAEVKTIKSEYSTEAIDKQMKIIEQNSNREKQSEKFSYFDALKLSVGYRSVVSESDTFRGIGFGAEYNKYFANYPYLGFGIGASYSNGETDDSHKKGDTATVIDFGLKGIIRYPIIKSFELYASGGGAYALAETKIDDTTYDDSFVTAVAELGGNMRYDRFIFGLKYKISYPFNDDYKFIDDIVVDIGFSF